MAGRPSMLRLSADRSWAPAQGPPSDRPQGASAASGDAFLPLWTHRPRPRGPGHSLGATETPSPPGRGSCSLALWSRRALGGTTGPGKAAASTGGGERKARARPLPAEGAHASWPRPPRVPHVFPSLSATISVQGRTRSPRIPALASEATSPGSPREAEGTNRQPPTLGLTCSPGSDGP